MVDRNHDSDVSFAQNGSGDWGAREESLIEGSVHSRESLQSCELEGSVLRSGAERKHWTREMSHKMNDLQLVIERVGSHP